MLCDRAWLFNMKALYHKHHRRTLPFHMFFLAPYKHFLDNSFYYLYLRRKLKTEIKVFPECLTETFQ